MAFISEINELIIFTTTNPKPFQNHLKNIGQMDGQDI